MTTISIPLRVRPLVAALLASLVVAAVGTPIAASAAAATPIVTEIMQNPDHTVDSRGEWFEVHNPGAGAIDLAGWTIRDDGRDAHVVASSVVIPAGGYAVLGRNADAAVNGGVTVDYAYGDTVFLFNGTDQLELVSPEGTVVDRVAWDDGATFPDPVGASMSLRSPDADNAVGANWCTAVTVFASGDLGTPGAANVCEEPVARIVINEVLQNPDAIADRDGEWIELYNAGSDDVSLAGWTLRDDDTDTHQIPSDTDLVVPAGGFVVLTRNGDTSVNGGIVGDYDYSGMILHNTQDEIVLIDETGRLVDRVAYDDGVTFPDPRGASMSLRDPALNNAKGANWCESPVTSGPADTSTPGLPNDCTVPEPPAPLFITEIMQNPANGVLDKNGEWFEVHNPTDAAVDLAGWIISDDETNAHVIAESVVIDPGAYAVFARNGDTAVNGGVAADYVYGNDIILYNGRDELVLTAPTQVVVDRVAWDNGLTFPDPDGASMALGDMDADNAPGGNWCTSVTPFGDGNLATPGAPNDCGVAAEALVVVISEIHQNPYVADDTYGEWFELTNPTDFDININGWTIRDDDSDYHQIDAGADLVVPAGGSIVIGRSYDGLLNGGAPVDYSMGGSVHLYNTTDELEIVDPMGRVVDRVAWSHEAGGWYVRNGASMALVDVTADNATASAWCVAGSQYGAGDLGTPGVANDCGPRTVEPAIVISEIMQNPAAVPDSAGEWFELHNPGRADVDIDGWTVRDNDFASHVIDNGGPLVVPAGGYIVIGRNGTAAENGGVELDYALGADVTLYNGVDELELLDASLRPVDWVRWDDGATFPDPSGASMSLRDPALDNASASAWCVSVTEFGMGDLGTPGAPNLCEIPPVGEPVDLAVDLNDKYAPVKIGDRLRYEVIVRNESATNDTVGLWDVVLTLPEGVAFNKDYSHQRWSCDATEFPVVRCTYDDKKPVRAGKKSDKISIEVIVEDTAISPLVATAATDLSDAEFHDPNQANDSATVETTVEDCPPQDPSQPI